nr:ganglioside-induced differentiation-associated protein 2 [Ipomoea trifida]
MISETELLHKFQVFKVAGRDKCGRKILQVTGKYFPARSVSVDAVTKYLEKNILPELEDQPFSVLYLHAGVEKSENFPGISGLRAIYDAIPVAVRENIEAVYFVHPGLQSRLFLATFGRFIFAGGIHGKIKYVSRVDYLWEHLRRKEVELPEFVYDHDEYLEYRPMIGYGLEGDDHPRVYGMSTVDSPVIMYSTRCIS